MDSSTVIQLAVSVVLTFLPGLIPDLAWYFKVIIGLCIVLASLCLYCWRLCAKMKSLEKGLEETKQRHQALAVQFDQKGNKLRQYQEAFSNLSIILHMAMMNTKQAKLQDIYEAFLLNQERLQNGGNEDDQQNRENH